MTSSYATLGGVVDRLLRDYEVGPDDVITLDIPHSSARLHLMQKLDGLKYEQTGTQAWYYTAKIEREDVPITLVWIDTEAMEAA